MLAVLLLLWPAAAGAVSVDAPAEARLVSVPVIDGLSALHQADIPAAAASPFESLGLSQAEAAQMEELAAMTASPAAQTAASPAPTAVDPASEAAASAQLFDHAKSRPAAAEIELAMSSEAMSLLTTADGTVAPVLRGTKPPRWLARRGKDWAKTSWDSLTYQEKIKLLRYAGPKVARWDYDRAIPGLVPRDSAVLEFAKSARFLGKRYPAGRHEVSLTGALGKVEYRDESEVGRASGLELHLLSDRGAGAAAVDAWTLLDGLGLKRVPMHVHGLGKPLKKTLTAGKAMLETSAFGEAYRRANLLAEFVTVAIGGNVYRAQEGLVTHFGYMTRNDFGSVLFHLLHYFQGGDFPKRDFKIAWVGLRGPGLYTGGGKRLGMEYRAVHPKLSPRETKLVLDAVHGVARAEPRAFRDLMRRWQASYPDEDQRMTWYASEYRFDAEEAGDLKPLITPKVEKKLTDPDHAELRMLVHDWSKDPILLGDGEAQRQVRLEQARALQSLDAGDEINVAMKRFLRRSGLYPRVLASFRLKEGRFGRIEKL